MQIVVTPVGGKRIDAQIGRFTIHTDLARENGGAGLAPDPFTLFLTSLATGAASYVVAHCEAQRIPTAGIRLVQRSERDAETGRLERITLEVQVPAHLSAKHREAIARAAAACEVTRVLAHPPALEITTVVADGVGAPHAA